MTRRPNSVAIGNFDGVHAGHQSLLQYLISRRQSCHPLVLTFDPHPKAYFNPEFPLICTSAQRKELVQAEGIDDVRFQDFGEITNLEPEAFVRRVLVEELQTGEVVVGHDFRFGKKRTGKIRDLTRFSRIFGFQLTVIPPLMIRRQRVSSTMIRDMLQKGRVGDPLVLAMLTRRYFIDGQVIPGRGVGRSLGFPTVNTRSANRILPEGVFETQLEHRGRLFRSVTNIGNNPTFNQTSRTIETYILDFREQLYGEKIRLHFVRRIRDERKFPSAEALVRQIRKDLEDLRD